MVLFDKRNYVLNIARLDSSPTPTTIEENMVGEVNIPPPHKFLYHAVGNRLHNKFQVVYQ
jgi:hypothetical protein